MYEQNIDEGELYLNSDDKSVFIKGKTLHFKDSDDKSIFIKETTLHFKDWEFECFEWKSDGIKKPCNVDTIISEKKHAFALSTELSTDCQALSSSYSVVKCVKFINCTFKSEPDI